MFSQKFAECTENAHNSLNNNHSVCGRFFINLPQIRCILANYYRKQGVAAPSSDIRVTCE